MYNFSLTFYKDVQKNQIGTNRPILGSSYGDRFNSRFIKFRINEIQYGSCFHVWKHPLGPLEPDCQDLIGLFYFLIFIISKF